MKALYLALFTSAASILCLCSVSFSQVPFRAGIQAGANFANLRYSEPLNVQNAGPHSKTGIVAGAILEMRVYDILFLIAEPRYIQKGTSFGGFRVVHPSIPHQTGIANLVYRYDYFELPVLLKARFSVGPVSPFVFAGPSTGFLVSSRVSFEQEFSKGARVVQSSDFKQYTRTIDFGIDVGIGFEVSLYRSLTGFTTTRYSRGLLDISYDDPGFSSTKTRGFQVLAGILFDI